MTRECFSLFVLLHFVILFLMIACIFVDLFFVVNWFLVTIVNVQDNGGLVGRTSLN